MPMNFSGRSVDAARRVIEIEDVFEPMMAPGFSTAHRSLKILRLTSSFSTAVSITRSQEARPSSVAEELIFFNAARCWASVMTFFVTCRDRLPLMVAIADFSRSSEISFSTTLNPARAATCAMPLPICPDPITPIDLISFVIFPSPSVRGTSAASLCGPALSLIHQHPAACRVFRQASLTPSLGQMRGQKRHNLIKIADQAVIRDLENRRILVLVDRHDPLRILHAGEMLDRTGDTDGDIKIGRDHLAG